MSVPVENMKTLMQWLGDSDISGAQDVTDDLARLVFLGDTEWPNYEDRASSYADAISAWCDGGTESQFIALTAESGNLAAFIQWIGPVIERWDTEATQDEASQDGQGLPNPNHGSDPTPGTEFYKYDEPTGNYLYSATADGSDWATYEQRRYSEPTLDDSYGLRYRYDKRDEIYEWYDEENGTWNSQGWADEYAASRAAGAGEAGAGEAGAGEAGAGEAGAEPQAASAAAWDENWQMFYRIGSSGAYEYADAVVPGSEGSGSSEVWLSYEQVMTRATPDQAGPEPVDEVQEEAQEEAQAAIKASSDEVAAAAAELLEEHPEFAEIPEERRQQIMAEVLSELQSS
jgi:hypothetical protein